MAALGVVIGGIHCPVADRWEMLSAPRTPVRGAASEAVLGNVARELFASPSLEVQRRGHASPRGLVGRFLDIAPLLLHGGRNSQTPPPRSEADWWATNVMAKFLTPNLDQAPIAGVPVSGTSSVLVNDEGNNDLSDPLASRDTPGVDWWSSLVDAEFVSPSTTSNLAASNLAADPQSILQGDAGGPDASSDDDSRIGSHDANPVQLELEAAVCVPLQTPLVRSRPRIRRARTPVSVGSLRRSGRIAAQPRAANATAQAHRVLLKKLGVAVEEGEPDEDVVRRFKLTFNGDMTQRKQRALQLYVAGGIDVPAMDLDLDGLEDGGL